ncbi:hypothetical protein ACEPPZ_19025 [Paracoccus yeei]|uniref:hypothetical protein n=1 Tax=Paracoccus yeei TaxID=147645 RepID=UPI0037D72675
MIAGLKGRASGLAGRWLLSLWLCACVSACADRQAAIDAATALAEAAYPGQLELVGTHLQKDHYDVVFAIRGDPFTRIRFGVDRDASRCRPASPCEDRLHPAEQHQQPALDRLTPCNPAFRTDRPPLPTPDHQSLKLRLLLPEPGGAARAPALLTLDTPLADARSDEISFLTGIGPEADRIPAESLRVHPAFLSGRTMRDRLVDAAETALAGDPGGGQVATLAFPTGTRLDPQRLDVIRSYILACSTVRKGQGPCRTDIAVRLRHDLGAGEVIPEAIIRDIRDAQGNLRLSPLPGRGVG